MDRRAFLRALASGLAGTVAGATLDLDRLLWVPGQKRIFLPPVNRPLAWDDIVRETLRLLERELQFASRINRQYAECDAARSIATVSLKRPSV